MTTPWLCLLLKTPQKRRTWKTGWLGQWMNTQIHVQSSSADMECTSGASRGKKPRPCEHLPPTTINLSDLIYDEEYITMFMLWAPYLYVVPPPLPPQVWMLRLPVRHGRADEAVRTGPLSSPHGRKRNSLTFAGETFYCRKVSGVQSGEQIVIICLSRWPASNLMKFDGEGRFRTEGDWMHVIRKHLEVMLQSTVGSTHKRAAVKSTSSGSNASLLQCFKCDWTGIKVLVHVRREHTVYFNWSSNGDYLPLPQSIKMDSCESWLTEILWEKKSY